MPPVANVSAAPVANVDLAQLMAMFQNMSTHQPGCSLPNTESIPKLTGRKDFPLWFDAVVSYSYSSNVYSHISEQPPPGVPFSALSYPSYPPPLSDPPTAEQLKASDLWYQRDNLAIHIVISRLDPEVSQQISTFRGHERLTARQVLTDIRKIYGVVDYGSALVLQDEILALRCGGDKKMTVEAYISAWRQKYNAMVRSQYQCDAQALLRSFQLGLPNNSFDWRSLQDDIG